MARQAAQHANLIRATRAAAGEYECEGICNGCHAAKEYAAPFTWGRIVEAPFPFGELQLAAYSDGRCGADPRSVRLCFERGLHLRDEVQVFLPIDELVRL